MTPVFVSHFNSRLYPIVKMVRRWNRWWDRAGGAAGTDFLLPTPISNSLLTRCFSGERHKLARLAQGKPLTPYRFGVSLMALLRREEGSIEPRPKPRYVAADYHDPSRELATVDA